MTKVVSLRLSDAEDIRLRGAAAITGTSISEYIKWLIGKGAAQRELNLELLVSRVDELLTVLAKGAHPNGGSSTLPASRPPELKVELLEGLKKRGIPSSTIRQVEITWDEITQKRSNEIAL